MEKQTQEEIEIYDPEDTEESDEEVDEGIPEDSEEETDVDIPNSRLLSLAAEKFQELSIIFNKLSQ